MFSRFHDYRVLESIAECKRVLQSITECYRVLTSITKCYRVLHSVPECYRVLENATENNTVLQSINDYYRSENDLFLTLGLGTSSARNKNLRPLFNRNIPQTWDTWWCLVLYSSQMILIFVAYVGEYCIWNKAIDSCSLHLMKHSRPVKFHGMLARMAELPSKWKIFPKIIFASSEKGKNRIKLQSVQKKQDHQWWRYHRRLLVYQSPYF